MKTHNHIILILPVDQHFPGRQPLEDNDNKNLINLQHFTMLRLNTNKLTEAALLQLTSRSNTETITKALLNNQIS